MYNRNLSLGLAAATVLSAAGATSADLIDITQPNTTLSMVIGNQFRVGDKLFSVPAGGFSSTTFNPALIFISPVINDDADTGEGFRLSGSWNDAPGDASSLFSLTTDIALLPEFVTAGNRINGAALRFNGFATEPGSSSRFDSSLSVESQSAGLLTVLVNGGGSATFSDQESLNNLTALRMITVGTFTALGDTGTAGASFMDLSLSRTIIPAPTTRLALTAGALTLTRRRR